MIYETERDEPALDPTDSGLAPETSNTRDLEEERMQAKHMGTPIKYLPLGEQPSSSEDIVPGEKMRIDFESNAADVQRDSHLTCDEMELAFTKLAEHVAEQDRKDAFVREATRRACL